MDTDFQAKLTQLRDNYHQLFTSEHRHTLKRLLSTLKQHTKTPEEEHLTEQQYYQSLQEQISNLERKVKNHAKSQMSDYQAFRWSLKKEGSRGKIPQLSKHLKIPDQIRRASIDKHHSNLLNIKILTYSVEQLCRFANGLMEEKGKCRQLMKQKDLIKLIRLISDQYNINSYHNFTHSVSVLLLFRHIQTSLKLNRHFTQLQLFIAQMAALAHDLGHKGLNAMWEIKNKTPLSLIYEGISVLQKMHITKFFRLLRQHPQLDFFNSIKDQRIREASKKQFVNLILGTDMSRHFRAIQSFQSQLVDNSQALTTVSKDITLQLIFHAADIGNPCMQFDQYMNWSILLTYQFNNQANRQEKLGIEVTQGLKYINLSQFYEGQIGFITIFCLPLWKSIRNVYPQATFYLQRISQNCHKVEDRLKHIQNISNSDML